MVKQERKTKHHTVTKPICIIGLAILPIPAAATPKLLFFPSGPLGLGDLLVW